MANLVLTYVSYFVLAAKFTISYCSSYSKPGIKYVSLFVRLVFKVVEAEYYVSRQIIYWQRIVSQGVNMTHRSKIRRCSLFFPKRKIYNKVCNCTI